MGVNERRWPAGGARSGGGVSGRREGDVGEVPQDLHRVSFRQVIAASSFRALVQGADTCTCTCTVKSTW